MPSILPPKTDRDMKVFKVPLGVIGLRDISCGHTTKFCPRETSLIKRLHVRRETEFFKCGRFTLGKFYHLAGSCVLKASAIECRSIPSIDISIDRRYRHLDRHSIDISVDSR